MRVRSVVRVVLSLGLCSLIAGCAASEGGALGGGGSHGDLGAGGEPGDLGGGTTTPPKPQPDLSTPINPNDQDNDGVLGGLDCDDHDATVYPGAPEVCDGKDNDCDTFVDNNAVDATVFYPDADADGLGNSATPVRSCTAPTGWVTEAGDCDDHDASVGGPGTAEFCMAEVGQNAVFVSGALGNDGNSGASPPQAVQTVGVGIQRALKCSNGPCAVLIAKGDYSEPITLGNGVSLYGGYSDDFMSRDLTANVTRITSTASITVVADSLTKTTRLDGLTIEGADLSALSDGTSSYALWVQGVAGTLTLASTTVLGGHGATGVAGGKGVDQACSSLGGPGGVAEDCNSSRGTDGNAGGDPTSGGSGGSGGSNNCPNACPLTGHDGISGGGAGSPGGNGADGAGGVPTSDTFGQFMMGLWLGPQSGAGARGFHGTGGGGGGSGGTKRFRACFTCGTLLGGRGGDGAPGGCGGGGGAAGAPGGGAFGVVLVGSSITLKDSNVTGGMGGTGGKGGDGIAGKPGSTYILGGLGGEGSQKCGLINYSSGGGGVGGTGGNGGAGGGGAGGAGGPGVAIVLVGTAMAAQLGTVTISPGLGGAGGQPGGGPGTPGTAGPPGGIATTRGY